MRNSKRGSSTVFITLIVATLMTIILALVTGARNEYVSSRADGIISLAGDSVMSEFDYYVQQEYGLFILGGRRSDIEAKLADYIDYGLRDMNTVKSSNVRVSGSGYSLANCQQIKAQIIAHMKYVEAEGFIDKLMKVPETDNDMKDEVLRNGPTIVSLPSYDMPSLSLTSVAESLANNLTQLPDAFKTGTDNYLINRYILAHFNNLRTKKSDDHFFRNEVEYVLGGKLSDQENKKRVEMAIVAMRYPLNLKYILTDQEKMEALLAAAELLTPEAAPATQMVLAASWAYMESDNDVELLEQGHRVPINKDKKTWAVDLDSLLDGINTGTFKPDVERGNDYNDYLQMLLFVENSDLKMARIMDLIQINMRMNYDKNFVMGEHCVGMHMSARVGRRGYSYEKVY